MSTHFQHRPLLSHRKAKHSAITKGIIINEKEVTEINFGKNTSPSKYKTGPFKSNQFPEIRAIPQLESESILKPQLESEIRKAFKRAISKYKDDDIFNNLESIKSFVLNEIGSYLYCTDIADKRIEQMFFLLINDSNKSLDDIKYEAKDDQQPNVNKQRNYFSITNLLSNNMESKSGQAQNIITSVFPDMNSAAQKSFKHAKEIELQTGFPLLSWLYDMYLMDRVSNAFNVNPAFNKEYDINAWFNDNLYAKYVSHTHPNWAHQLTERLNIMPHLFPPLKLANIEYRFDDDINKFALYSIASYRFIESIVMKDLQHIFPIQIDIKIIPKHIIRRNRGYSTNLQDIMRKERYILNTDYFEEDAMLSVDFLAEQLLKMWIHKGDGKRTRSQRYVFIIERNGESTNDRIYLIRAKSQPAYNKICDEYYYAHESLLHLSQKDNILRKLDDYVLSLSFHLFQVGFVKAYCKFGKNGGTIFELNEIKIKWLWHKYFISDKNGEPQALDDKYINMMKNIKQLPNVQFNEFFHQSHDESNAKLMVNASGFYDKIEATKKEIVRIFKIQYDEKFAEQLQEAWNKSIWINKLQDMEAVKHDINDVHNSEMLQYIWEEIGHLLRYPEGDKKRIGKVLQDIIIRGKARPFDIMDVELKLKKRDVLQATEYFKREAPTIAIHHNTRNPSAKENPNKRANDAEDKSFGITKAVDLKNGYPILKWLHDLFSRDRIRGHQTIYRQKNVPFFKYQYHTDKYVKNYNATIWWLRESSYCKYIQQINPKMSLPMMTAVQGFCKRALPPINLDWTQGSVIHDNFNSIVEYMLASYGFIYELTQNKQQSFPIQVDFAVIPQLTTAVREIKYNQLGTYDKKKKKVQHPIWEFKQYLLDADYVESKDYVCAIAEVTVASLQKQIHKLWKQVRAHETRYRRYVIIVDRRNPENVTQRNMGHERPKYWKTTKKWNDSIYLIIPKEAHKISKEIVYLPEIFHANSNKYLLPKAAQNTNAIGILDRLNGYRMCLSYHVLDRKSSSVYFYANRGGHRFELEDIEWLWPRFFNKFTTSMETDQVTKDGDQKLNEANITLVKQYIAYKRLVDDKFEEFRSQAHDMRVV